jgi:hypothetical protein
MPGFDCIPHSQRLVPVLFFDPLIKADVGFAGVLPIHQWLP